MGVCGSRHQPCDERRQCKLKMKVCQYCGSVQEVPSATCQNCGANAFANRCENCGETYTAGNFCPKCGVRAGDTGKICPKCGKRYFSNACPDCGYVAGTHSASYVHAAYPPPHSAPPVQKKKPRTGLWVLGWICMFPVPLTILMVRNKKLPRWARILIITLAWLVYLAIGLSESGT